MFWRAARLVGGTAAVVGGGWALRALQGAPEALGASPAQIDPVTRSSPHYRDGVFVNLEPASEAGLTRQQQIGLAREIIGGSSGQHPASPVPLVTPDPSLAAADLAVTWYGHSSAIIEVDGYRILADPVWSDRCSPSRAVGPQRLHPVPAALEALPAIDAVIISHDHYDHLDVDTIKQLALAQRATFFVPLGIGAHLRAWHIPDDRIVELDWNQSARLGELELVCTPARHFSGRFVNRDVTLWASWAIVGPRHRAFFGGDTGYTKSFADIGTDYGPFDVTLMPVGAYHPGWPDIHMNPEDAVRAHRDVTDAIGGRRRGGSGGLLVPIHWATFRLATHPWSEPIERLLVAASAEGVTVATPRPGQRIEAGSESESESEPSTVLDPWWRI